MTDDTQPLHPIPNSYWVIPGRLLAGEYPSSLQDSQEARRRLRRLLQAGVRQFVDLTQPGEFFRNPYPAILPSESKRAGLSVQHLYRSIRDMDVPTLAEMGATLDLLENLLAQPEAVYLHCYGGLGRTGTVVGCYLVRQGLSPDDALARISELRRNTPFGLHKSPETDLQRAFVHSWAQLDPCRQPQRQPATGSLDKSSDDPGE